MPSSPATEHSSAGEPLAITSTTFESTLGQSTEKRSSAMVSYKNGQTLLRKLTTTQEITSLSPTDKSIMTSTIGCPPNMIFAFCNECQSACQQPNACYTECSSFYKCICSRLYDSFMKGDDCVPAEECGCFIQGQGVIPDNAYYTSDDCSYQCFCLNDVLDCQPYLNCSDNAMCEVQDGVGLCNCNEGFDGNGETCSPKPTFTDCNDVYNAGYTQDGVYSVTPLSWNGSFDVFCSMSIDGGGWTVFQRRVNGSIDFFKSWNEYREGFGDNQHEFWLGNEKLYHILQQGTYEVRVDTVMSVDGSIVTDYHKYSNFQIGDETTMYRVIDCGQWSGTQGQAMHKVQDMSFSTYDQDNDGLSFNCAFHHQGGWWYGGEDWSLTLGRDNCKFWFDTNTQRACTGSNPNGVYNGSNGETIFLQPAFCDVYYFEMKIRRTV
ncbi:Ficolin-2 [Holothuria leucospilota]|uniref:Ficolin-2 n=1 Tax=Holothuria leucospilota TaxID=206669 RepID=A0A9Q1BVL5_HOLLE|nr:Ficolin-2 [Holothuria leucospilota]